MNNKLGIKRSSDPLPNNYRFIFPTFYMLVAQFDTFVIAQFDSLFPDN